MTAPPQQEAIRPLLLTNIGQLLTLRHPGGKEQPRRRSALAQLSVLSDAGVLIREGKVAAVGHEKEVTTQLSSEDRSELESFDCKGGVVLPGFVDSHTHPVFTAPRLIDFKEAHSWRHLRGDC